MYLKPDSLAVVLLGDWCNLYSKPDWLADNIFKSPDIEIGVNAQDNVTNISCKQGPVIIRPSQAKVAFMTTDIDETTLDYLEECVKNILKPHIHRCLMLSDLILIITKKKTLYWQIFLILWLM